MVLVFLVFYKHDFTKHNLKYLILFKSHFESLVLEQIEKYFSTNLLKMTKEEDNKMDVSVKIEELSYEEKVTNCNVIAKPMASKKLAKKCYKLIKKGKLFILKINIFKVELVI